MSDAASGPTIPSPSSQKGGWKREEIEEIIEKVDDVHDERTSNMANREINRRKIRELESENQELKTKLETFQQMPPITSWVIIGMGFSISLLGYIVLEDLIYAIGGVTIILIGVASVIEALKARRVA